MNIMRCFKPSCQSEAEYSCNCSSPETYSCSKHLSKHHRSSSRTHTFNSIFLEPVEGVKESILRYIAEEMTKNDAIKFKLVASFAKTLCNYENTLKQLLKEIDFGSTKFSGHFQKVWQVQKLSKLEDDPVLNLLSLDPHEAVEKAKVIFQANKDIKDEAEMLCHINIEIDRILKKFNKEKLLIPSRHTFKIKINLESPGKTVPLEIRERGEDQALSKYKEAIKINPSNDNAYNGIGTILYNEKSYEEAIKYFNDAIRVNPNKAVYYRSKGNALYFLNRKEEAMECFEEAFRIDPTYDAACSDIGDIFYDKKKYEKALEYYSIAIKIDPKSAIYYNNKGNALYDLSRREESMECYKEAIKVDPHEDYAYNGIGIILYNEKSYEEAIKYYSDAIRINPNLAIYYRNKGNAFYALNRKEEALECFREAVRIDKEFDAAYSDIGDIFYDKKKYDEAVVYYSIAIRINPNSAVYPRNKENALEALNRREEA